MRKSRHYKGCSGYLCPCEAVDRSLRLAPEAQLDAIYAAEAYWYAFDEDPACAWPEYCRRA